MARRDEFKRDRAPDKEDNDGYLWRHWGDGGVGKTVSARLQGYDPSTPGYIDIQVDSDGVLQTSGSGGGGGSVEPPEPPLGVRYDDTGGGVAYVGEAVAGTLSSVSDWRIKKVVETGSDIVITWASSGAFSEVWDDRLGLTYG